MSDEENKKKLALEKIKAHMKLIQQLVPQLVQIKMEMRMPFIMKNFPNLANTYPMPIKYLCQNMYIPGVFKNWALDFWTNPKKGIEGFSRNQADYVKMLIPAMQKRCGRRIDRREALIISNQEYDDMLKSIKEIREVEKEEKKRIEEETKKNNEDNVDELVKWLHDNDLYEH